MAQELLVKEALSPEMISAGRALVSRLDEAGWKPTAAFWLFNAEQNRWKLTLSSPDVETRGPRPGYEIVSRILAADDSSELSLADISILAPRKRIVKVMSQAGNAQGSPGLRISRGAIDGHYIDDAYIYRS